MCEETEQKKTEDKRTADRKKLRRTITSLILVVAVFAGVVYAWFFRQMDISTLLAIREPSAISILGPNGEEMSSIDLNYGPGDKEGNKVTVRRVFCVQTAEDYHRLEIVHTTNLKGLEFKLYPVDTSGTGSVTDGGKEYNYRQTPLTGKYINVDTEKSNADYRYADKTYHSQNYATDDPVQSHAEPVYWLADNKLETDKSASNKVTIGDKEYYRTYYVCEVSWTEKEKETDIFYILADNASKFE